MSDEDILELKSPIASPVIFGELSASIEYHLTCLIEGIHKAGYSHSQDEIDRTIAMISDCQSLAVLLMNHYDKLRLSQVLMQQDSNLGQQERDEIGKWLD
jgi:hypothetical protein